MTARRNKQLYVIAHNIRSLHNVGAIFRTADALGVSKVYLTGYTGAPPDPKIAKVALGAEQYIPWEQAKSPLRLIKKLKLQQPKLRVVALENNVKKRLRTLDHYKPSFPLALIIGEEVRGVGKNLLALADEVLEIPMRGQKESLNVSVAFGIAVYQLLK